MRTPVFSDDILLLMLLLLSTVLSSVFYLLSFLHHREDDNINIVLLTVVISTSRPLLYLASHLSVPSEKRILFIKICIFKIETQESRSQLLLGYQAEAFQLDRYSSPEPNKIIARCKLSVANLFLGLGCDIKGLLHTVGSSAEYLQHQRIKSKQILF